MSVTTLWESQIMISMRCMHARKYHGFQISPKCSLDLLISRMTHGLAKTPGDWSKTGMLAGWFQQAWMCLLGPCPGCSLANRYMRLVTHPQLGHEVRAARLAEQASLSKFNHFHFCGLQNVQAGGPKGRTQKGQIIFPALCVPALSFHNLSLGHKASGYYD